MSGAHDNAPRRRPVCKADFVSAVLILSILVCGFFAIAGVARW